MSEEWAKLGDKGREAWYDLANKEKQRLLEEKTSKGLYDIKWKDKDIFKLIPDTDHNSSINN